MGNVLHVVLLVWKLVLDLGLLKGSDLHYNAKWNISDVVQTVRAKSWNVHLKKYNMQENV